MFLFFCGLQTMTPPSPTVEPSGTWQSLMQVSLVSLPNWPMWWTHSSGCWWRSRVRHLWMLVKLLSSLWLLANLNQRLMLRWKCSNHLIFYLIGVSIEAMKGSNTAVFIGCGLSEALEAYVSDPDHVNAYAPIGCSSSMLANRISYAFDLKGNNLNKWYVAYI